MSDLSPKVGVWYLAWHKDYTRPIVARLNERGVWEDGRCLVSPAPTHISDLPDEPTEGTTRNSEPAETFPPLEFVNEMLDDRGLDFGTFAKLIGRDESSLHAMLVGERPLVVDVCERIATVLGTSVMFWKNLDIAHRKHSRGGGK